MGPRAATSNQISGLHMAIAPLHTVQYTQMAADSNQWRFKGGAAMTALPVNLDAERFVLGSILDDDAAFDEGLTTEFHHRATSADLAADGRPSRPR